MTFGLYITSEDVVSRYGIIDKGIGYTIVSSKKIKKKEIGEILGAFVDLEFSKEEEPTRKRKFTEYVESKPKEEWDSISEYCINYKPFCETMEKRIAALESIKEKYAIISISPSSD